MIRFTLDQGLTLHLRERRLPGAPGLEGLESALSQPRMASGGQEFYPSLAEKAAATEVLLVLNGHEINPSVDHQEETIRWVAAGELVRADLATWIARHMVPLQDAAD